ncbi:MAG: ABC transporter ATP-binding protein [Acidobacteriota bacterium]
MRWLIDADGVGKDYGRSTALAGVSFGLSPGEVVGLAGANGAGKSTLFQLAMGFLEADRGRLAVLGGDPLQRRHLGRVGWMPEQPSFPRGMRVSRLLGLQRATFPTWDPALSKELESRLEIDRRAVASAVSRGQKARIALLCALAHRPRLLLLDDPTLGLDPAARRLLLGELLGAAVETGTGILISSQLLAEIEPALDRVLVIDRGRLLLDEEVESLRARWRRLELPLGADLPADLQPLVTREAVFTACWDAETWAHYRRLHPEASARPAGLEDIFVALTQESPS